MTSFTKIIFDSITGLILGTAVLFLALVAAVGFAFATNGEALIPGVFKAWFTSENDMPAMNFEPNFIGMLVVIVLLAGLYVLTALRIRKRATASRQING